MRFKSGSRVDAAAPDRDPEAALVARVAAREQAAFAELYGIYRKRLARFLGRFLASPDTIDETVNDVMFVVWQDAARFELRSKVSTWIFGIAWRKALKALERQKRVAAPTEMPEICRHEHARLYERRQLPTIDIDSLLPGQVPVVEDGDPVELVEIRNAVFGLDEKYRVPLVMQVLEGRSTAEIAAILRVPRQTVLTRLFRARRLLRERLAKGAAIPACSRPVNAAGAGRSRPSSQRQGGQASMRRDRAAGAPA